MERYWNQLNIKSRVFVESYITACQSLVTPGPWLQ